LSKQIIPGQVPGIISITAARIAVSFSKSAKDRGKKK